MDPTTGSFLSTDPMPGGPTQPATSPYLYADDQPTVLWDPSGNTPLDDNCGSNADCVSNYIGGLANLQVQSSQQLYTLGQSAPGGLSSSDVLSASDLPSGVNQAGDVYGGYGIFGLVSDFEFIGRANSTASTLESEYGGPQK
jgi:hypothetical protein